MKRKLFFSLLIVVLVFFVTSICVADSGKKKDSENVNANKQSMETSTRGQERAEERHQIKEQEELGKVEDDSDVDDKKEKKEKKKEKKSKDDPGGHDKDKEVKSDDKDGASSEEEGQTKKGKWWEFFKKSEE